MFYLQFSMDPLALCLYEEDNDADECTPDDLEARAYEEIVMVHLLDSTAATTYDLKKYTDTTPTSVFSLAETETADKKYSDFLFEAADS